MEQQLIICPSDIPKGLYRMLESINGFEQKLLDQNIIITKKLHRWHCEPIIKSASLYKTPKEWENNDPNAYAAACRLKILDIAQAHMITKQNKRKWTEEALIKSALPHKTLAEWDKADPSACVMARNRGIFDLCTQHMTKQRKWTEEELISSALPHKTSSEWQKNEPSAYVIARNLGIHDLCMQHMTRMRIKWSHELIMTSAARYKTSKEWRENEPKAYDAAKSRNMLDEINEYFKNMAK